MTDATVTPEHVKAAEDCTASVHDEGGVVCDFCGERGQALGKIQHYPTCEVSRVAQALANSERDGLEQAIEICGDRACHFRKLANREKDHSISDDLLGIAKGFSKARPAIRALKDKT